MDIILLWLRGGSSRLGCEELEYIGCGRGGKAALLDRVSGFQVGVQDDGQFREHPGPRVASHQWLTLVRIPEIRARLLSAGSSGTYNKSRSSFKRGLWSLRELLPQFAATEVSWSRWLLSYVKAANRIS